MKTELKTFRWICDHCKRIVVTTGIYQGDSRPPGWITTYSSCGDHFCAGDHESDYCDKCVEKAKKTKKADPDTYIHYIKRALEKS